MGRTSRNDSDAIFHPVWLQLASAFHRASLDGNQVAVLSGRDPKEFGSVGRMPGGKATTAMLSALRGAGIYAYRSQFFQRNAVLAGHILRCATTASITPGATVTATVDSHSGFSAGDWVAIVSTANAYIGQITALSGTTTMTVTQPSAGGGSTTAIPSGSIVYQCMPMADGYNLPIGAGAFLPMWAMDLRAGMNAKIYGHRDGAAPDAINISAVRIDPTNGLQVDFTPNLTYAHTAPCVCIPDVTLLESSEAFTTLSDSAELLRIAAGALASVSGNGSHSGEECPWSMTLVDRDIIATNGRDDPIRISMHTGTTPSGAPYEVVGFPATPNLATPYTAGAAGSTVNGVHRIVLRFIDKSVFPYAKSTEFCGTVLTITGNARILIDIKNILGQAGLRDHHRGFQRATHLQIWMTSANNNVYFLAYEYHLSQFVLRSGGSYDWYHTPTQFTLDVDDNYLFQRMALDANDRPRGRMPNGKFVHHQGGITYVGGLTSSQASSEHPRVQSANQVYFSRTDADEPENFPADNMISIGGIGDEFRGFAKAGESTVHLFRYSFATSRRFGTLVQFDEKGGANYGLAYKEAFCSLGDMACWVSDDSIWLFDGNSGDAPIDIGFPIRDWVQTLKDAHHVRVKYDPVNKLIYVGKMGSNAGSSTSDDSAAECMVYHNHEQEQLRGWVKRENLNLDGPFVGFAIESATSRLSLYRCSGPYFNVSRIIDYDSSPVVDGGYSPTSNVLYGTVAATNTGVASMTGLTLPAGASNALTGAILHFIHGDGTESVRMLSASSSTSVTWRTGVNLTAGDRWVIGAIPFRLRFPTIRGQDPFIDKTIIGAQVILDAINYGGQSPQNASLTMKIYRDLATTLATGQSATIPLTSGVAVVGRDRACAVQATGNILEVQVEQLDRHVDFSLIYVGMPVRVIGTFGGDRNSAV